MRELAWSRNETDMIPPIDLPLNRPPEKWVLGRRREVESTIPEPASLFYGCRSAEYIFKVRTFTSLRIQRIEIPHCFMIDWGTPVKDTFFEAFRTDNEELWEEFVQFLVVRYPGSQPEEWIQNDRWIPHEDD